MSTSKLKVFVAHRVTDFLRELSRSCWRHVRTHESLTDLVSWGQDAKDLLYCRQWWEGPPLLIQSPSEWPTTVTPKIESLLKPRYSLSLSWSLNQKPEIPHHYSSLHRLMDVHSYCQGFHTWSHAEPSTVMSLMAQDYYMVGNLSFARRISRECVLCQCIYAKTATQTMVPLPSARVTPT